MKKYIQKFWKIIIQDNDIGCMDKDMYISFVYYYLIINLFIR